MARWHGTFLRRIPSIFRLKHLASASASPHSFTSTSFPPTLYPISTRPPPIPASSVACSHLLGIPARHILDVATVPITPIAHYAARIIASRIGRCPAPDVVRVSLLPSTVHRAGRIPRPRGPPSV
ncbi:hypothetical protein GSI_01494 [Ganoderma sinense ZZ0214-1]|uniref:Uncharacterized protein n=1 Tax=Ganoderma sinense ZZ0214-1 TaxID=1077348 RepID=A0A2G8SPZ8_9APHY|nr:hypothetical protein GSI_01494 [Ganoderma sinense ZZ0214-1]